MRICWLNKKKVSALRTNWYRFDFTENLGSFRQGQENCSKQRIEMSRLSYIIPELDWEFETSKRILENLGNFRKTIDKFENFRAIWTFTWHVGDISQAKTLTKRFCRFVFQPNKREVSPFISYIHQCLEHWAQRFFIRVICTTTYQRLFTKRGRTTHCF